MAPTSDDRSPKPGHTREQRHWLKLLVSSPDPGAGAPGDFSDYEAGKRRRYELLFAVNGGAFALASWLWDDGKAVGGLTLAPIGYGLAGFTWLMSLDLFAFGLRFRNFFGFPGKLVIVGLSTLLIAGWLLAADTFRCWPSWTALPASFVLAAIAAALACFCASPVGKRQAPPR